MWSRQAWFVGVHQNALGHSFPLILHRLSHLESGSTYPEWGRHLCLLAGDRMLAERYLLNLSSTA